MKHFTIRIEPELKKALKRWAKRLNEDVSSIVRRAIVKYLIELSKEHGNIKEEE